MVSVLVYDVEKVGKTSKPSQNPRNGVVDNMCLTSCITPWIWNAACGTQLRRY